MYLKSDRRHKYRSMIRTIAGLFFCSDLSDPSDPSVESGVDKFPAFARYSHEMQIEASRPRISAWNIIVILFLKNQYYLLFTR